MIITFRLSDKEFEEHLSHRENCPTCDDLAHLYLAVANLAHVKVFVDRVRVHPPPNHAKLVEQLVARQATLARKRLTDDMEVWRRRLRWEVEQNRQAEVAAIIRHAYDRQEEQEANGP